MHKGLSLYLALFLSCVPACQPQPEYQSKAEEVFPAVKITRAALFRMGKVGISPAFFRGQWTGVLLASAACGSACQQRLALANEEAAGQYLLVIVDLADHARLLALQQQYPGVEVSMGTTAASIDNFLSQFKIDEIAEADRMDYIYLISPQAELSYRLKATELKSGDLRRELKALGAG